MLPKAVMLVTLSLSHKSVNFSLKIAKENQSFCLPNYAILCNYRKSFRLSVVDGKKRLPRQWESLTLSIWTGLELYDRQLFSTVLTIQGGAKDEPYKSPKYQSQGLAIEHISKDQTKDGAEDKSKRCFDNGSGFGV
jgi:hypothetical protein